MFTCAAGTPCIPTRASGDAPASRTMNHREDGRCSAAGGKVDEFSGWPGTARGPKRELVGEMLRLDVDDAGDHGWRCIRYLYVPGSISLQSSYSPNGISDEALRLHCTCTRTVAARVAEEHSERAADVDIDGVRCRCRQSLMCREMPPASGGILA